MIKITKKIRFEVVKKSLYFYVGLLVSCVGIHADMTEMVFYPSSDFSSAVAHFYHQGDKSEKYGFVFDEGFDPNGIFYAQPDGYTIKTRNDKKVQLLFDKTDRYSYMQQLAKKDFIVGEENTKIKLLISSGDCVGSATCMTQKSIISTVVPKGYKVLQYQGLDHELKPLVAKEFKIKEGVYTLIASNVKGSSMYLELEKSDGLSPALVSPSPHVWSYDNTDIFKTGDVVLSSKGYQLIESLSSKVKENKKIFVGVFQDRVPPKRLFSKYPSSETFSKARAETLYKAFFKLGLTSEQIRIEIVDKPSERTRVDFVITPAQ